MDTIEFVIRASDDAIRRGAFGDGGVGSVLAVSAGDDVSINLRRFQVQAYGRDGDTLVIVLTDGQELRIENFFSSNAELYLSADGELVEVALSGEQGGLDASYVVAESFGKWSPDDVLYFTSGPEIDGLILADAAAANEQPAMLATGLLTGLGGLGGAGLAGGAAVIGGLGLLGAGDSEGGVIDAMPPALEVREGVVSVGHVFDDEDHKDGVEIGGTSEPGATVTVTIGDAVLETVVDEDGGWAVVFDPDVVVGGEYDSVVEVTATDPAGNSTTVTEVVQLDTETTVSLLKIDGSPIESDPVINTAGHADGVTLTGGGEPGASVTIDIEGGPNTTVIVDRRGIWSVEFEAVDVSPGTYEAGITITAIDLYGNTATTQGVLRIDTETTVTITGNSSGVDNVVNDAENSAGSIITGTAEAGATVELSVLSGDGVLATEQVVADADGQWSADIGSLPEGEYETSITAVATDAVGNTASDSAAMGVDTEVALSVNDGAVDDGPVVNIVEAADGVILSGTSEPGGAVDVNFAGSSRTVVTGENGQWQAGFAASDIPMGTETVLPITASYTDAAGNTATAEGVVEVDTIVRNLGMAAATGDNVIDATEALEGFTLEGTTESGAQSVTVALGSGPARAANVDAAGNWAISFGAQDIPAGSYASEITVSTVDRNGNVDSITTPVQVDTDLPEAPIVIRYTEYTRGDPGVSGIGTQLSEDISGISQVAQSGAVTEVAHSSTELPIGDGELLFSFEDRIPNGSSLVVEATDSVGNENSTLVVLDEGGVDPGAVGVSGFDIGAIDLSITEESVLTITEADLRALSGASDTLVVHGDSGDTVNAAGAVETGQTEVIGGQTYTVYALGEGNLIIDSDISVNPLI